MMSSHLLHQAQTLSKAPTAAKARLLATSWHLVVSSALAVVVAFVVLGVWYPGALSHLSGGTELFWIVITVDVVLGPLITLSIFDIRKPNKELRRDISMIALLQLAALIYGMQTLAQARPAVLALEGSRVRVVRALEISNESLAAAPAGLRELSLWGPRQVATRQIEANEVLQAAEQALLGNDIGMRPEFWLPADQTAAAWIKAARPATDLLEQKRFVGDAPAIEAAFRATGLTPAALKYLPVIARTTDRTLLIDANLGTIVGYAPVDSN
jgi:hypothetical protein